ncbi:MAG: Rieske (2Fe-2S) protein [Flavobacteriales bacterium]
MFFEKKMFWHLLYPSMEKAIADFSYSPLKRIHIDEKYICLVHFNGQLSAVADKCPHQGASLSWGYCNESGQVVCPWHHYAFSLKTGRVQQDSGEAVDVFPVKVEEDGVYIGIEKKVFTLF